jgi:glycosylphosphatidylinositol transamidase (GPIT) subunit GPI8
MAYRKNTNSRSNVSVKTQHVDQSQHTVSLTKDQKIAKFGNFIDSLNDNDKYEFSKYTLASNCIDIEDNKAMLKKQQSTIDDLSSKVAQLELNSNKQSIPVAKAVVTICKNFNSEKGCKFGINCHFSHVLPSKEFAVHCIHFKKGYCKNGNDCKYAH